MSTPPEPSSKEWPPPGDVEALEPDTVPGHPLRASDCEALLPKELG